MNFDYSPVLLDATPAIAANGDIYCSAPWRSLTAFLPNGDQDWHIDTIANLVASPVIAENGAVYVSDGRAMYAINSAAGLPPQAKSSWPMFRADPRHTGRVQIPR
jgi:outer membrane protein assembly factor BamB